MTVQIEVQISEGPQSYTETVTMTMGTANADRATLLRRSLPQVMTAVSNGVLDKLDAALGS